MPKTFAETYDLFRKLGSEGSLPSDWSLPQFSRAANDITGGQDFSAGDTGVVGGAIKKASYWIDKGLDTPLPGLGKSIPEYTGQLGQSAFQALGGDPQKGYEAGHALPRSAVDFAPLMIPGVGEGYGLAMAGAAGAAHTYAEGGGPLQIAGSAVAPKLMEVGGGLASRALADSGLVTPTMQTIGNTLTRAGNVGQREVQQEVLTGVKDKALNFIAHQFGAVGAAEATNYATDAISQGKWNPYEGQSMYDRALGIAASTIPFAVPGLGKVFSKNPTPLGHPFVKAKEAPVEEALPDMSKLDPYQLGKRGIEADTARQMNAAMGIEDATERQTKLDAITQDTLTKRKALDVAHGKTPLELTNDLFGRTPEVDQSIQALHDAFKSDTANLTKASDGYDQAYLDHAASLVAGHEAAKAIPELHVDDVKDEAGLVQAHNDTTALHEVSDIVPQEGAKDIVMKVLDNAGTPPDESLKNAVVGERNDTVKRVRTRAKRKIDNAAMQEGKNALYEMRIKQADEELAKAIDGTDTQLKASADEVLKAQRLAGASEGINTTWLKWKEELEDPSKRDSSWKGKRNPIEVLKSKLGARVTKEQQAPYTPKIKSEDVDHAVAHSAMDSMLEDLQATHGLSDDMMRGIRDSIAKGGDALGDVRELLKDLRKKTKAQQDGAFDEDMPKRESYREEPDEGDAFEPDEFKTADENEEDFQAAGGERYRLKAGNDFLFRMEDPIQDASGKWMFHGKPIGKEGTMFEAGLKSVTGMKDGEMELYRMLVPEAFKDGKVNVPKLAEELKTKGPVVETHVYGQSGQETPAKAKFDEAVGELDRLGFHIVQGGLARRGSWSAWDMDRNPNITPEMRKWYDQAKTNEKEAEKAGGLKATQYYNSISPFDTKKYPVVRVDVVLPKEKATSYQDWLTKRGFKDNMSSKTAYEDGKGELKKDLWSPDNLHENLPNTLGWAMVQFVPHPATGEIVMYVGEQQSRWGQEVQGIKSEIKNKKDKFTNESLSDYEVRSRQGEVDYKNHPLLDYSFNLSLKAAIREAQKRGVTKMVVSDGESAMMTEQHDTNTSSFVPATEENIRQAQELLVENPDRAWHSQVKKALLELVEGKPASDLQGLNFSARFTFEKSKPSQDGGMRLHYDKTLPSIAEKLTGEKGEMVDMGVHKNAEQDSRFVTHRADETNSIPYQTTESYVKGSPVFRNADGTPKTSATGRIYDISKVESEQPLISQEGRGQGMDTQAPTSADVFQSVLTKTGFGEKEVNTWTKSLQSMKDLFGIDKLRVGELINDVPGKNIAGLANMGKMRDVFLSRAFTSPNEITGREVGMTLAHELGHIIDGMAQRGEIPVRFAKDIQGYKDFLANDPQGAQEFMGLLRDTMHEDYRSLPVWDQWLTSTDPKEMYANSMAMWAATKASGDEGRAFGLVAAPEARTWLRSLTEYARRVTGAIRGMLFGKPSLGSDLFKGGIEHVKNTFDGLTKSLRDGEMNMEDLNRMAIVGSPDVYVLKTSQLQSMGDSAAKYGGGEIAALAQGRFDDRHELGLAEKIIAPFLKTQQTIGEMVPAARVPVGRMLDHAGHMQMLQNEYLAPLAGGLNKDTGSIDMRSQPYQDYKGVQASSSRQVNDFVSELSSWMQQPENKGKITFDSATGSNNIQDFLSKNDPEHVGYKLGTEFKKLSKDGQSHSMGYMSRVPESNRVIWKSTVDAMKEQQRGLMRTMINTKDPSLFTKSDKVTKMFADGMNGAVSPDPAEQMKGQQKMEMARQMLGGNDEVYAHMLDMWSQVQSDSAMLQSKFDPWHFSMIKRGAYKVRALNSNGKEYTDILPELGASYRTWQDMRRKEGYGKFQEPVDTQQMPTNISQGGDLLSAMKEIEDRQREKVKLLTDIDPALKEELLSNMDISGDMARYMKAGDISTPAGLKGLGMDGGRKATPGSMDMVATQQMAHGIVARINATRSMSTHFAADLMNPELARFPSEVKQMKDGMRNYMTPDTQLGRAITRFNSTFYLAGNIPTHMLNLMQSYSTTAAEAVNHGMSPVKAMMAITKAAGDVGKFTLDLIKGNVGLDKEHLAVSKIKDTDERALFEYMIKNGHWSFGSLDDLQDRNAGAAGDMNRISRTGRVAPLSEKVGKPLSNLANFTMKAFAATEHFNQRIAALLGHRIAKENMGANYNQADAFEFAKNFMRSSTFAGGRANRPIMQGNLKTVGNVAYGLQGYTVGWLNNLYRYMAQWKGAEYSDLTPPQRQNARNAALTMLGVQFASAGALGMPFVGAALKGLESVTGQSITGNAYAKLGQLLDDDKEDGGGMANVIMNGAANAMLANSGVNVDLGSRWAMGGVFGINPHDGFSSDAVFGPTGQTVASVVGALKSVVGGDLAQAGNQLAPPALKKAIALWRNGGEIRTSSGAPVESTAGEKLGYSLGFTPQSLSNLNQYQGYKKTMDASTQIQNKQEASQLLDLLKTDPDQAKAQLAQISRTTGESPQVVAKRVATMAADQAFAVDVRRATNNQTGRQLMSMVKAVGVPVGQAQEAAKGTYVQGIMNVLGVRPSMVQPMAYQKDSVGDELTPFSVFHRGH